MYGVDANNNPLTNTTCNFSSAIPPQNYAQIYNSASLPTPNNIIQYGQNYFEWLAMEKNCTQVTFNLKVQYI